MCLSAAISHNLIKLEAWNFADVIMYAYTGNGFFYFRNSDFTTLNQLFNKQCLLFSLLILAQRLLKPTDLPQLRLPKPRDLPQNTNWVVPSQSSTYCLYISLFSYPQRLLKPTDF